MIVIPELPKGKIARPDDWREWYNFSQTEFVLTLLWSKVTILASVIRTAKAREASTHCNG